MNKLANVILLWLFFLSGSVYSATTEQIPTELLCFEEGVQQGYCRIVFPQAFTSCSGGSTNVSQVLFNPKSGVLGQEIFSMAMAAVSARITLRVSYTEGDCSFAAPRVVYVNLMND